MPSIVVGELWTGFLQGQRRKKNQSELDDFLTHPARVGSLVLAPSG